MTRTRSRRAYSGRVISVDVDTVVFPNGTTGELEMVRHPGASAVVPFLDDPRAADPCILLIRQYRYAAEGYKPYPMKQYETDDYSWLLDVRAVLRMAQDETKDTVELRSDDPFFGDVCLPMLRAWRGWKAKDLPKAAWHIDQCVADDWRVAGTDWLARHFSAWEAKKESNHGQ